MPQHLLPRYPVYVPSKGRADQCLTARFFRRDAVPFFLVVEPQEAECYASCFPTVPRLILPENNQGLIYARNWIKAHAMSAGYVRHWQFDDNIQCIKRRWHGKRIPCKAGVALAVLEDFSDRYENVAIAGLNYEMFLPNGSQCPPFNLNVHVYSATLVLNALPFAWRLRYNDDTDLCLQVLAAGWCTVLCNVFLVFKTRTMKLKGGNTTDLYQGDGRLRMARSLERMWPGVVETKRRFRRPQHVIAQAWKRFDTPLRLKPGITLDGMATDEYGMSLVQQRTPRNAELLPLLTPTLGSPSTPEAGGGG